MIEIAKPVFGLIMLLLVILAGIMSFKATRSVKSRFSLDEAFLDRNGKTSFARIGQFVALAVSTWGFVFLTLEGKMSEWYMTMYMGAWVLNGIGHKGLEKWLDKPKEMP